MFNLKEWKEKQKKTLPSRQEVYRNGISENEFLQECITCHQSKPLTEFSSDFGTTSGYSHKCKSCVTAYNHKNRLDNLADRKNMQKNTGKRMQIK